MDRTSRLTASAVAATLLALSACGPLSRTADVTAACTSVLEAIDAEPGSAQQVIAVSELAEAADEGGNPELAQLGEEIAAAIEEGDLQHADELLADAERRCEEQGGI